MGEIAGVLDISEILEGVGVFDEESRKIRIAESLKQAKAAVELQRELFDFAHGFNPDEMIGQLTIGNSHVISFVKGMCQMKGIGISATRGERDVFQLEFDDSCKRELGLKNKRLRITFDRRVASRIPNIHILDMESHVLKWFLSEARQYEFSGLHANISGLNATALVTSMLRWQNDQGARMRQEFAVALVRPDKSIELNPDDFSVWLEQPAEQTDVQPVLTDARSTIEELEQVLESRLGDSSNSELHPENIQLLSSAHVIKHIASDPSAA
jgi:hypothetical protein